MKYIFPRASDEALIDSLRGQSLVYIDFSDILSDQEVIEVCFNVFGGDLDDVFDMITMRELIEAMRDFFSKDVESEIYIFFENFAALQNLDAFLSVELIARLHEAYISSIFEKMVRRQTTLEPEIAANIKVTMAIIL